MSWLRRSYIRAAIIPLFVVEISFLAIYWASSAATYRESVGSLRSVSSQFLADLADREALGIGQQLRHIEKFATLLASQAGRALRTRPTLISANELSRYAVTDGVLHTVADDGGTASFYSRLSRNAPDRMDKVLRLSTISPLMIDLENQDDDIASVYFKSNDSYNLIYPYIDVLRHYKSDMNIPSSNFYLEADAEHNPLRVPVWTDAYLDPAGHGWMVSAIAPVWVDGELEGVAGIDLSLRAIISQLDNLKVPWGGYAMLVGRDGRIIGLPAKGERDLKLEELAGEASRTKIPSNEAKPPEFDIHRRLDLVPLAIAMHKSARGQVELELGGGSLATYQSIHGPDWTLVLVTPKAAIFSKFDIIRSRAHLIGWIMLGTIILFYVIFFLYLAERARQMGAEMAEPVRRIGQILDAVESRNYDIGFEGAPVRELDHVGHKLVRAARLLQRAQSQLAQRERTVMGALVRQQQLNLERTSLIRLISHAVRTPLSVIDSGAQILARRGTDLQPEQIEARTSKMRAAIRRISNMLDVLLTASDDPEPNSTATVAATADWREIIRNEAMQFLPPERIQLDVPPVQVLADEPLAIIATRAAVSLLVAECDENGRLQLALTFSQGGARLSAEAPAHRPFSLPELYNALFANKQEDQRRVATIAAAGLLEVLGATIEWFDSGEVAFARISVELPAEAVDPARGQIT